MDIDLDAGEEVEVQSAEEAGDALKRNRSGGIGLVASGIRNFAADDNDVVILVMVDVATVAT